MNYPFLQLVVWHLVGFVVTGSILACILLSLVRRQDPLTRFAWMDGRPLLILACSAALSFIWQFSDPTFSTDYGNFGFFADSLAAHGTNFYYVDNMYHDYLYGPVSVLLLSVFRPLPFDWLLVYRAVLASFNLVTGLVLYRWFKGARGLVASLLFLFNPLLSYTLNAGLNDAIMIGLLSLGLYFTLKGRGLISGSLLALAFLTKQDAAFVVFGVLVWYCFKNGRRSAGMVVGLVATVVFVSLPFVLTSQDAMAYFYAVFQYPFVLSINGKGSIAGNANIGFSGIWSALRGLGLVNLSVFSLSTPAQIILALFVTLIARRKSCSLEDISSLGFSIFLIGSKYLWNNHFVAFLPLAILVLFAKPESQSRTALSVLIVTSGILYVMFDGYSILKGSYPPSYVIPDLLFFSAASAFFVWALRNYGLKRSSVGSTVP